MIKIIVIIALDSVIMITCNKTRLGKRHVIFWQHLIQVNIIKHTMNSFISSLCIRKSKLHICCISSMKNRIFKL